jgi:hypothetical protein
MMKRRRWKGRGKRKVLELFLRIFCSKNRMLKTAKWFRSILRKSSSTFLLLLPSSPLQS